MSSPRWARCLNSKTLPDYLNCKPWAMAKTIAVIAVIARNRQGKTPPRINTDQKRARVAKIERQPLPRISAENADKADFLGTIGGIEVLRAVDAQASC
jgi:hypothetical protein